MTLKNIISLFFILLIGTAINCQTQKQDESIQLTTKMPSNPDLILGCPFRRCCPRFRQCPRDCPFCPFRQTQN
jgi:hypothetical protein